MLGLAEKCEPTTFNRRTQQPTSPSNALPRPGQYEQRLSENFPLPVNAVVAIFESATAISSPPAPLRHAAVTFDQRTWESSLDVQGTFLSVGRELLLLKETLISAWPSLAWLALPRLQSNRPAQNSHRKQVVKVCLQACNCLCFEISATCGSAFPTAVSSPRRQHSTFWYWPTVRLRTVPTATAPHYYLPPFSFAKPLEEAAAGEMPRRVRSVPTHVVVRTLRLSASFTRCGPSSPPLGSMAPAAGDVVAYRCLVPAEVSAHRVAPSTPQYQRGRFSTVNKSPKSLV